MKLIITILSLIIISFEAYSQTGAISPKSIRIGTSGPNVIKWSPSLVGADTTHDNFVPTAKAVNDRIRAIAVTDIKRSNDSIFIKINNAWVYKFKDSTSNTAAVNARVDSLIASLLFNVVHIVTTINATATTIDTLPLNANEHRTYDLTFHAFNNTLTTNERLRYKRTVDISWSDGVVTVDWEDIPIPDRYTTGSTIGGCTVSYVVSGTLVLVKVTGLASTSVPWLVDRSLNATSTITAH